MHHALYIQEILFNIFGHCHLPDDDSTPSSDLPALARTCRAFKEPALDVLWGDLDDPSPLAQCLPETCYHQEITQQGDRRYSFTRSLTQLEWNTLRSYTRRILSITDYEHGLDWESVKTFLNPPPINPLFPNLRCLYAGRSFEVKNLLCMPFPSLISLAAEIQVMDSEELRILQDSLESISKFSPNLKKLFVEPSAITDTFSKFFSRYICRWKSLHTVCVEVVLDVDSFVHLSRMPELTHLTFALNAALSDQITPSNLPLSFPNLQCFTLCSDFLDTVSRLLSQIHLPALTGFRVYSESHYSNQVVSTFLANIQISGNSRSIQELWLIQTLERYDLGDPKRVIRFEYLQPCMAFINLRRIKINIVAWEVDLTDSGLLTLASAWPHLEHLLINEDWGWMTQGGITPDGLLQLLQTCPSLNSIALAINTRGCVELPPSSANLGLSLPPSASINVVDSFIEAESVPAMATFFSGLVHSSVSFAAWEGNAMNDTEDKYRWYRVFQHANEGARQHP